MRDFRNKRSTTSQRDPRADPPREVLGKRAMAELLPATAFSAPEQRAAPTSAPEQRATTARPAPAMSTEPRPTIDALFGPPARPMADRAPAAPTWPPPHLCWPPDAGNKIAATRSGQWVISDEQTWVISGERRSRLLIDATLPAIERSFAAQSAHTGCRSRT
jgi:hypothetical protein